MVHCVYWMELTDSSGYGDCVCWTELTEMQLAYGVVRGSRRRAILCSISYIPCF